MFFYFWQWKERMWIHTFWIVSLVQAVTNECMQIERVFTHSFPQVWIYPYSYLFSIHTIYLFIYLLEPGTARYDHFYFSAMPPSPHK